MLGAKEKEGWLNMRESVKKGKWNMRWVALRAGIVTYYENEEKGGGAVNPRLGRVDLGLSDGAAKIRESTEKDLETGVSHHKDGGGKSGKEPSIRIAWREGEKVVELRAAASTGMGTTGCCLGLRSNVA